ncbi:hypothetical protein DPMN_040729 [Dreissena polymorpha]|uniref:Dynamin N-terminal domain-containing protein n=1 Tax=Dreissena polymorpha TaxID=45954 RepID=A0A9D4HTC7_DREPO|nr:hypothetical protein DPMN_040729 [Dreissena polymorpha]
MIDEVKCTKTDDNVDSMDIDGAKTWLERRDIKHYHVLLEDMKNLIRTITQTQLATDPLSEAMTKALSKCRQMQLDFSEIYKNFDEGLKKLPKDAKTSIQTEFKKIDSKLATYIQRLSEPNCIILVAGETSAGKSSFLNLLMERDVLPTSHLAATSTICLIHPIELESTRYFEVHLNGKKPKKYIVSKQNENEMLTKLQKKLVCREERYRNARVDIYWQVPLLDYNVSIMLP